VRPMIETARTLNPGIRIVAQAIDEQEAGWLLQAGVDAPVQAKLALAEALRVTVAAQRAEAPVPEGARQAPPGAVAGESHSSKPATG
jgi:hypothetical protein